MKRETYDSQQKRKKIMEVMNLGTTLNLYEIADKTGLNTKQIGRLLVKSINDGHIFRVGETRLPNSQKVSLYSIHDHAVKPTVVIPTGKQYWFSPLMPAA
jgi:hypothetical protein